MFPPIASTESILDGDADLNPLTRAYHDVVVYGDVDSEEVLYEGPIVVHANGWLELEGNRLLSPSAVHHVDVYDDEDEWAGTDRRDAAAEDDDRDGADDRRTGRFRP